MRATRVCGQHTPGVRAINTGCAGTKRTVSSPLLRVVLAALASSDQLGVGCTQTALECSEALGVGARGVELRQELGSGGGGGGVAADGHRFEVWR